MKKPLLDSIIEYFSPSTALARQRSRIQAEILSKHYQERGYDAASRGNRTELWKSNAADANRENRYQLDLIRYRARDLERNNSLAKRSIQVITNNTIGRGIDVSFDIDGNSRASQSREDELNARWKQWAGSTDCDWAEELNLNMMQSLVMKTTVRDGECLTRIRFLGGRNQEKTPLKLQILEADFLDMNLIKGENSENLVISGVEVDEKGRKIAFWLYKEHPGSYYLNTQNRIRLDSSRIQARFILHTRLIDRPGAVRSVSWLHPVMLTLKDFDEYQDAQLVKQKVSACMTGFITDQDTTSELTDTEKKALTIMEPATMFRLGPGQDIKFSNPPSVDNYDKYTKAALHNIATGLGVTYESLTSDYSQVNFSSARMAWLEFSRNIDTWRNNMFIPLWLEPVVQLFLEAEALRGFRVQGATWKFTPPRREMIDPTKEIPAIVESVRAGVKTLKQAIRESGYEPDVVLNEIAKTNAELDSMEIILDSDPRKTSKRGDRPKENNSDTTEQTDQESDTD